MPRSRRHFISRIVNSRGHDAPPRVNARAVPDVEGHEPGFHGMSLSSFLLLAAVAATIAFGMLSLCAGTALTLLANHASVARSFPT